MSFKISNELRSIVEAVTAGLLVSLGMTSFSITLFGEYGFFLFLATPVVIGLASTLVYNRKQRHPFWPCFGVTVLTLLLLFIALLLLAFEGVICMVMSAPLVLLFALVGVKIALGIHNRVFAVWVAAFIVLPSTLGYDLVMNDKYDLIPVTTAVVIDAPPEEVWNQVIDFSPLDEPEEWYFKAGIAYPVDACIDGNGEGAVRYCNFSTGSFVEPITKWEVPKLLRFSVEEQPIPMTELSPYDIEPRHLHDYFVSKKGQFALSRLEGNKTLLEGTTWYYHKIRPVVYWQLWSDFIIHRIHARVLSHVKKEAERTYRE